MRLDFFPSRTMSLYLAKLFVVRIMLVLVLLVLVLLALDLLLATGKILSTEGNGQAEIVRYASLRLPQLVSRYLPYSMLLATLISLVTLNQSSEFVTMKAAGLSARQVLSPLLLTAAVVAVLSFGFKERVVTRANTTLKAWEVAAYGPIPADQTGTGGVRSRIYLSDGGSILTAATLTGSGHDIVLSGVTWYDRGENGIIREQVRSERATYAAPGWRLQAPERFNVAGATTENLRELIVGEALSPGQIMLQFIDPDAQSFWELSASINAYETAGPNTDVMRAKWWHRLSGPLWALLMPLLGFLLLRETVLIRPKE